MKRVCFACSIIYGCVVTPVPGSYLYLDCASCKTPCDRRNSYFVNERDPATHGLCTACYKAAREINHLPPDPTC